jgi:FAD dependent oxidoreductase
MPSDTELIDFQKWMCADLPGLYLLGSVNRHITVHSQQCRAINLIHALIRLDGGLDGRSMAIVGAGFAGLTAAAYALEKTTAKVALFETAPRPLWVQDHCANRWLHPGIYDWPSPGSLEPRTSLPVLNWHADKASNVAKHVRAEWERIAARKGGFSSHFETKVDAVTAAASGNLLVEFANGQQEEFDVVVLAVGFGLETGRPGRISYWNDADGLDDIPPDSTILISGFGDGGLADVLRLCLPEFRQDNLVELVRHVPDGIREQLVDWEERFRGDGASLDRYYKQLRVDRIVQKLKSLRPTVRLTLAGQGHLYGQRSAILNRFLVSQLRQAYGENAFELVEGPVDEGSLTELPNGRRCIKLGVARQERAFDNVMLRLGPEAAYRRIRPESHWAADEDRRRHWRDMPQSLDRTRMPLWKERSAPAAGVEPRQDFLAYESSSSRWCLVVHPPKASINWAIRAGEALERLFAAGIPNVNKQPLMLCSLDALASEAAIKDAVRALCAADIVIADVTGYDPSVLLLLGIRAAVRRAVTITCTKQAVSSAFWKAVPFNLKELKLISLNHVKHGLEELVEALSAGLTQSSGSPGYLDLPVYDYVRQDPPERESSRVLLLRAFKSKEEDRTLRVESRIRSALRQALNLSAEPLVETVIDQASPRLAGQRLYEAIRHWHTCVVDLTWWRANVMFELGVRLAVRANQTFCLIDESVDGEETFTGTRALLRERLSPFSYDLHMDSFADAFKAPIPTWVYETAAGHFRTRQDHLGQHVDEFLETAAPSKPSDDPLQVVDVRQLYARDNLDYAAELSHSSVEMRCAAWYYLADRERPHLIRPIDLLDPRRAQIFDRFQKLGSRLKTDLLNRREPQDKCLRDRIDASMKETEDLGTAEMARLLKVWRELRLDPPWNYDVITLEDDQRTDLVAEWEDRGRHLAELQANLERLGNPVCELPLHAIRSDLRRLGIALQQFKGRIV